MKVMVSGLINIETTLKIKQFPISYYPIDYPFFGIQSNIAGVAYNVARALQVLGDEVELISFVGKDEEGERIKKRLQKENIIGNVVENLKQTPVSIVLFDATGKRQIYCDLKDVQEQQLDCDRIEQQVKECDVIIACNTNFNRSLLKKAKQMGKIIATDVHVLEDLDDAYNKEFMEAADILFLSDERLPYSGEKFLLELKKRYPSKVIAIGQGEKGVLVYERKTDRMFALGAVKADIVKNTVGAGDALFTSFLHYYIKGYDVIEAIKRAEVFAALKIAHNGAAVGFSTEEVVERHYHKSDTQISCKPISL